jgi:hypothetical protein
MILKQGINSFEQDLWLPFPLYVHLRKFVILCLLVYALWVANQLPGASISRVLNKD